MPGYFTLVVEFDGTGQHLPTSESRLFFVTGDPPSCGTDCLDVDLDGTLAPLTDGLLVLRYFFGFTGTTLVTGALGNGATRTDPALIVAYLDSIRDTVLDLDLDGEKLPLTDGLLLLRYLFGFRAAASPTRATTRSRAGSRCSARDRRAPARTRTPSIPRRCGCAAAGRDRRRASRRGRPGRPRRPGRGAHRLHRRCRRPR
jgi:hypothetical protein